jgi:hypothetical protein
MALHTHTDTHTHTHTPFTFLGLNFLNFEVFVTAYHFSVQQCKSYICGPPQLPKSLSVSE